MKRVLFLQIFILLGICGYAQTVMIRPDVSAGFFKTGDTLDFSFTYGGKILLMANNFQRYGVLIEHLVLDDESYLATGIFLEQLVFRYFNMGIGTVGYIGLKNGGNPFGIYSHLGFEYSIKRFHFLAAYRSDMIFGTRLISNNAIMLGVGIGF